MTLEQEQARALLVAYYGSTATPDELVQLAIDIKEQVKLRADGGAGVVITFENNDIIFPVTPLTSVKAFCKRKRPSTE